MSADSLNLSSENMDMLKNFTEKFLNGKQKELLAKEQQKEAVEDAFDALEDAGFSKPFIKKVFANALDTEKARDKIETEDTALSIAEDLGL